MKDIDVEEYDFKACKSLLLPALAEMEGKYDSATILCVLIDLLAYSLAIVDVKDEMLTQTSELLLKNIQRHKDFLNV